MASTVLVARSALSGAVYPGRYGARHDGASDVILGECCNVVIAHVASGKGKDLEVAAQLGSTAGAMIANAPSVVVGGDITVLGCGPAQWLVFSNSVAGRDAVSRLPEALEGLATVTDQSDAKVMVQVAGPRARDVLVKGCQVDLDQSVFGPGSGAATQIEHVACQVWQIDTVPTYGLLVNRSLAKSLWSWLATAAAEYGYEVAVG